MDRKQAENAIYGLKQPGDLITFVISECEGFHPQAIAEQMMVRSKFSVKFNCVDEPGGKHTITRMASEPLQAVRRGRPPTYVFDKLEPGQARTMHGLGVTQRASVRAALRVAGQRTGKKFKTSELSGELVVTRVDGTPDADKGQRFPFRATEPGAHFDVPSSPDLSVQQVRSLALYHGKVMGCRFSVEANDLGGCRVTRVAERPPGRAHQEVRIRPIPLAEPAPIETPPGPRAFDEEEF
jgi:hypothetical protein